jgi:hypothetical protein
VIAPTPVVILLAYCAYKISRYKNGEYYGLATTSWGHNVCRKEVLNPVRHPDDRDARGLEMGHFGKRNAQSVPHQGLDTRAIQQNESQGEKEYRGRILRKQVER